MHEMFCSIFEWCCTNMALEQAITDRKNNGEACERATLCFQNWFLTLNLANQPAGTEVGDLFHSGVLAARFHLKLSCINLKYDPQYGLFKHFMSHFFQRIHQAPITQQCVHYSSRQLGACSCWWIFDERMDPFPGQVEYSADTRSRTPAHTDTAGGVVSQLFYSLTPTRCQWRWY